MGVPRSLPGSRCSVRCCVAMGSTRWPSTRGPPWKVCPTGASYERRLCSCSGSHKSLAGDAEAADASMEDAAELGDRYGAAPTVSAALAERSVLAMERGDWGDARTYAHEARKVVEDGGLQDYMTSILTYATAARVALHEGDVAQAKRDLARAHRLRPLTSRAAPTWLCRPVWSSPEPTSRSRILRPPGCSSGRSATSCGDDRTWACLRRRQRSCGSSFEPSAEEPPVPRPSPRRS